MEIVTRCIQVTDTLQFSSSSGELIASIRGTNGSYVIGKFTSNSTWEPIMDSQHVSYSLSPNGEMLAILSPYDEITTLKIIYLDEAPKEVQIKNSLQEIMWFDNTYLTLISSDHSKPKSLFDPLTDQTKPFPLIPDGQIDDQYHDVVWFSPQGTSVVYLQTSEDFRSYYSREHYAIYDYENSTTMRTGLNWTPGGVDWSPEGDLVTVVSIGELHPSRQIPSQEIFIVDPLTSQTQQLANFAELLGGVFIESIAWSPDKKYLFVDVDPIEESLPESFQRELYLVDLQSNNLIDLCLDDVSEGYYYWSLDGKFITWTERNSGDLYLLEVATGLTLIIKNSEASLIGWMK
jgi:dipeptidyl aminopeptidase/acylaminoacyl peptidase